MRTVTEVPARLEPLAGLLPSGWSPNGWTTFKFDTASDAAYFVKRHPSCAMPCWKRFGVVNGELVLAGKEMS